jgi:eukaryotic-like serine/threonine-protein kinase
VIAGKYRLDTVLGSGGTGVVYAACHLVHGGRVALKLLRPGLADDARVVTRFLREARAATRIRGEHVVRVHDVDTAESGVPFIVMEHLAGTDLLEHVRWQGPFSAADAAAHLLQACEAVAEAHALGIVHRDLKSSNLFLTRSADGSPCVKVLDFGISKMSDEGAITSEASMIGSPAYMAPEQLVSASDVDARSDIWSLGVVLHELCTGTRPFARNAIAQLCMAVLNEEPELPSASRDDLPPMVDAIVDRCLRKPRGERYADVGELAVALGRLAPGSAAEVARVRKILARE